MIRPALMAALLSTSIYAAPMPVFAQAQAPVVTAPLVCQTFVSNANPYGYVGVANVDLGSVFSSIDTIEGTISGNRSTGAATITLPKNAPTGMWGNQGYFSPPWGNTGGWKSYIGYMGGTYPSTPLMLMDVVDVRFGTDDGIHPGKASVPQGVHGLYVVQRNEHGHAPMKLNITGFNLKFCGKAKQTAQVCQTLTYDESNPWSPGSQFTLPVGPKKVVSVTGSYTVAAANGNAAQTLSIIQPPGNQPRTGKFNVAYKNKEILSVMLFRNDPIPANIGSGYPNYLTMNQPVRGSSYLHHATSFFNGAQVQHGNVTGTVTVCVQ